MREVPFVKGPGVLQSFPVDVHFARTLHDRREMLRRPSYVEVMKGPVGAFALIRTTVADNDRRHSFRVCPDLHHQTIRDPVRGRPCPDVKPLDDPCRRPVHRIRSKRKDNLLPRSSEQRISRTSRDRTEGGFCQLTTVLRPSRSPNPRRIALGHGAACPIHHRRHSLPWRDCIGPRSLYCPGNRNRAAISPTQQPHQNQGLSKDTYRQRGCCRFYDLQGIRSRGRRPARTMQASKRRENSGTVRRARRPQAITIRQSSSELPARAPSAAGDPRGPRANLRRASRKSSNNV